MDVGEEPVGSLDVVFRDVFPNPLEVCECSRVERVAAHPPERRRSLFCRSRLNASSPSMGLTRPLLRSSYRFNLSHLGGEPGRATYPGESDNQEVEVGPLSQDEIRILRFC